MPWLASTRAPEARSCEAPDLAAPAYPADRLPPETGQNGGTDKVPSGLRFRACGAPCSLPGTPPQSEP
jgi:hypothetical protein